jgi:hypothetical protein
VNAECFIVTSHGWSASNWVAYSLHLNPHITCAHSSAAIIADDPTRYDGDGLHKNLRDFRRGYIDRQTKPIDQLYDDLQQQLPAPLVGTVHTYRLRDLPVQESRFGSGDRPYRTVNLVRHPLDLVISGYGQFLKLFRIDLNEYAWTLRKIVEQGLEIAETICNRHGLLPGDYDVLCFFGACITLGSLRLDLDALEHIKENRKSRWGYKGTVRMEDVTRSPQAFADLVNLISDRPDLVDNQYLDCVFKGGPINVHKLSNHDNTERKWAALKDWQRDAFQAFMKRFLIQEPYQQLSYDFSFLN